MKTRACAERPNRKEPETIAHERRPRHPHFTSQRSPQSSPVLVAILVPHLCTPRSATNDPDPLGSSHHSSELPSSIAPFERWKRPDRGVGGIT